MQTMRLRVGKDGRIIHVGTTPDGAPIPAPDPRLPRYTVSFYALMEAARTGNPLVLTPADDQET